MLKEAIDILKAKRMPDARIDVIVDNFAFLWLPDVYFDEDKYPEPHRRGLWIRIPTVFPFANPHGIVTKEPLNPRDGHAVKGYNLNHDTCNPIKDKGGIHYYSWTWGQPGENVTLRKPADILAVVSWIERRIRLE